ncbi:hypothetical protein [Croceicoccus sp. YJ47]|uniref:hypothetical protein n=1 Tax=Croceicoccus sp. YJ47 TaxID=2798724 RepID=UPI0019217A6F|nr:hypothetical protein [Croceicoccus sp. YJ47]QQN75049.1 hypothetical protein JD971_04955 [Croceicoccus sp. YJ47]
MNICDTVAFQIAEKGWRPFMGWGFALAAVGFAMKAVIYEPSAIDTFGALAAAAAGGFAVRAVEKHKRDKAE